MKIKQLPQQPQPQPQPPKPPPKQQSRQQLQQQSQQQASDFSRNNQQHRSSNVVDSSLNLVLKAKGLISAKDSKIRMWNTEMKRNGANESVKYVLAN